MRLWFFSPLLLLIITGDCPKVATPETAPQECAPQVFQSVTSEAWVCTRGKLVEKRFSVSPDNSGQISRDDNVGEFSFDATKRTLTITIRQHSASCADLAKALTETIDACRDFEEVSLVRRDASGAEWRIDAPGIKQPATQYRQIVFRRGDTVTVKAGGCAQHGGPGQTWALYVDPQKPTQTPDFYGQIRLPGMTGLKKLKDIISSGEAYKVPTVVVGDMFLKLGFSDFRHEDNGYWGREGDDGYDRQCKGVGNAWVEIKITHATR